MPNRPRGIKTGHRTAQHPMSQVGQTGPELGFNLNARPGRRPSIKDGPSNCCEGENGCNGGSIPRDPAGLPYSRPRCLSLHIRPLGICSRFADRGLSVFMIEGLPVRPNFLARPPWGRFNERGHQLRRPYFGWRSFVGRSISSYVGTWVLSHHDSSAAPQTVQTASPVCGTKNFSSVRLYSAPQLH
jgi:hypothetical protein